MPNGKICNTKNKLLPAQAHCSATAGVVFGRRLGCLFVGPLPSPPDPPWFMMLTQAEQAAHALALLSVSACLVLLSRVLVLLWEAASNQVPAQAA